MKDIWNWFRLRLRHRWVAGLVLAADGFLYALIAFVVVDYITGVLRAVVEKKVQRISAWHRQKVATFW